MVDIWEILFHEYKVPILDDKEVLEMVSGGGCTTM